MKLKIAYGLFILSVILFISSFFTPVPPKASLAFFLITVAYCILFTSRHLCQWIDTLNIWVGKGTSWVTFIVVLVVFVDVVMRYMFKTSFVFVQELEWHLFAFIFLIGAGNTLLKDGHVRVDIIYQRLSPKGQAWVNLLGVIFFLIPGCYLIIVTSSHFVNKSWTVMEGSPDPGGIPYRYLLKACIPAGFVLLFLQGISLGIKSFYTLIGRTDFETESES